MAKKIKVEIATIEGHTELMLKKGMYNNMYSAQQFSEDWARKK